MAPVLEMVQSFALLQVCCCWTDHLADGYFFPMLFQSGRDQVDEERIMFISNR